MLTDFEAYLLSKMRAASQIAAALKAVGSSRDDCAARAQRAAGKWGLDRVGYNADVYRDLIGEPISERILSSHDTVSAFVGSVCRLYSLPLWPKVLFMVNQHPSGYAWGEGFVQGTSTVPALDPSAVKPWEWVVSSIESASTRVEILEHWGDEKDLRLVFERGGHKLSFIAKFDFDLLQDWQQIPS